MDRPTEFGSCIAKVTNAGDYIYMVVNGACKHGDMAHFKEQMADFKGDVHMDYLETHQLLALQGKGAPAALQVCVCVLARVTFWEGRPTAAGCRSYILTAVRTYTRGRLCASWEVAAGT